MKKYAITTLIIALLLLAPSGVSGQNLTLSEFVELLIKLGVIGSEKVEQARLLAHDREIRKTCHTFERNLRVGDLGDDVRTLHDFLRREGFSSWSSSELVEANFFSERTAAAVVGFQEKYRLEILTPLGLPRGTGFVGPSTRSRLNALYGCPALFYAGITPRALPHGKVSTAYRAKLKVHSRESTRLFRWSISPLPPGLNLTETGGQCIDLLPPEPQECLSLDEALIYGAPTEAGAFRVTVAVGLGPDRPPLYEQTYTITIAPLQAIVVGAPNGGEVLTFSENYTITWGGFLKDEPADIFLERYSPPCRVGPCPLYPVEAPFNISKRAVSGSYLWKIGSILDEGRRITGGFYTVRICSSERPSSSCDSSDAPFLIAKVPTVAPSIELLSPNGGERWQIASTVRISWRASGIDYRAHYLLVRLTAPSFGLGIRTLKLVNPIPEVNFIDVEVPRYISSGDVVGLPLSSAQYSVELIVYDKAPCLGLCPQSYPSAKVVAQDVSDGLITIEAQPLPRNQPPVISAISAPTSVIVGEKFLLDIVARDPEAKVLTYSVLWGDEVDLRSEPAALTAPAPTVTQRVTFTHAYARPGTYTIKITVRDDALATAESSVTVLTRPLSLPVSVRTDKTEYTRREPISIFITARNNTEAAFTLRFSSGCQVSYSIASFDSERESICTQALTSVVIPTGGEKTWILTHSLVAIPLPFGSYPLTGRVIGYGEATTTVAVAVLRIINEEQGIIKVKGTDEYKSLVEKYGVNQVSVKAVDYHGQQVPFLRKIKDGFREISNCIIVVESNNEGYVYQLDENLNIVYRVTLAEFKDGALSVDKETMDSFYSQLK